MEERKKWIEDYEGLYWVTGEGRVISADRYDRFNRKVGGELKQHKCGNGYYFVCLFKDGKGKQFYVHRLVAAAFVDNPENKPEVDHIDNDKENNNYWNLRWVTHRENQNNPITRARMLEDTSKFASQVGADNPFSRNVKMFSIGGEYIRTFDTLEEAAKFVGIGAQGIGKACRGERKTAGGYRWKYDGVAKMKIEPKNRKEPQNKRPVIQLTAQGEFIAEYTSVQDAASSLGIITCNIVHAARGDLKTYKGYKWRYKE